MSPEIIGLAAGAGLGIVSFFSMRSVADVIERGAKNRDEGRRKASLVRVVAVANFIIFAVLGYVLGPDLFAAE